MALCNRINTREDGCKQKKKEGMLIGEGGVGNK